MKRERDRVVKGNEKGRLFSEEESVKHSFPDADEAFWGTDKLGEKGNGSMKRKSSSPKSQHRQITWAESILKKEV